MPFKDALDYILLSLGLLGVPDQKGLCQFDTPWRRKSGIFDSAGVDA